MELFNDLNVGWRHLLWAETSGHKDYPFKRFAGHFNFEHFNPDFLTRTISTPDIFNPNFLAPQRNGVSPN